MKTNFEDAIQAVVDGMDRDAKIALWNEIGDETVYPMDALDDELSAYAPSEIADKIYHGQFVPTDEYFWEDGSGNLYSAIDFYETPYDEDWMITCIIAQSEWSNYADVKGAEKLTALINQHNDKELNHEKVYQQ